MFHFIRKRNGSIEKFNQERIIKAIEKAMLFLEIRNSAKAYEISNIVVKKLEKKYLLVKETSRIPNVEEIQNLVEEELRKFDERLYQAYHLYRKSRNLSREIKRFFSIKDDLKFNATAISVLEERYLLKDNNGKLIETPIEMFRRVANSIANIDSNYHKRFREIHETEEKFFDLLKNLEFLPNSPTLMNARTKIGQLSACFVLPIEDSIEGIFTTLKNTAKIQQTGGGTGFNFSRIRMAGDLIGSTKGIASGPVSFIKIFNETTEVIKQGGKRRGANMAILNVNHPDIEKFIKIKRDSAELTNFNISVAVTNDFMQAVEKNKKFPLINPRTKRVVKEINARKLFDEICLSAWISGDPGLIFLDEINHKNNLRAFGKINATNPCGEVPLFNYESCNLGSINLAKIITNEKNIDWEKFKQIINDSIHFLDNVIDANKYPLKEIEDVTKQNRKIGLGIMGFADLLILLGIKYGSHDSFELAEKISSFLEKEARNASENLAKERGNFPNFKKSSLKIKYDNMRNATVTTIAPTGSLSILAGCSSGIEPIFALALTREILQNKRFIEINKILISDLIKNNLYFEDIINEILLEGSLKKLELPKEVKEKFITTLEISFDKHIKMQSIFQKYVDNAVSKTINLPENSKIEDVKKAYLLAWKLNCKGITIYRNKSKPSQVLYVGKIKDAKQKNHCSECQIS